MTNLALGTRLASWLCRPRVRLALLCLVAGSLVAAGLTHPKQVPADANRVFELRVYRAVPGKITALEARFRDKTSKLLAKHNLDVLGFWVAQDASGADDKFIWVVAYPSREEGKRNWDTVFHDAEFQELIKAEQADKLVEKVDLTFMPPTDFSAAK